MVVMPQRGGRRQDQLGEGSRLHWGQPRDILRRCWQETYLLLSWSKKLTAKDAQSAKGKCLTTTKPTMDAKKT